MRLSPFSLLILILSVSAAHAQSIMENLPQSELQTAPETENPPPNVPKTPALPSATIPAPASAASVPAAATQSTDPYTVTDVNADVTADTAAHARDQALIQAEHSAFGQLCARMGAPDSAAKISDDALAGLVQSFDVQSERLSPGHYAGVFTINFKPLSTQKKLGKYVAAGPELGGEDKSAWASTASHLAVAVQTPSLPAWSRTKTRLGSVPQVVRVDTLDLGRGTSHIDLLYTGGLDDLQKNLAQQGLFLTQALNGEWQLTDGGAP